MDQVEHLAAAAGLAARVHPTAIVSPGAVVAPDAEIGPWCTVGPDVVLEAGVRLISHVVVDGRTRIGAGAVVYPFCTVGLAPQDLKYKGEPTETIVGARTQIREHCTIHRGTVTGSGVTRVGSDCLLMAVVHVAHDCDLGDGVIVANNVVMGGHVHIGDGAVVGGATALHQFVRIGRGAMVGGASGVRSRRDSLRHRAGQSRAADRAEHGGAETPWGGPGRAASAACCVQAAVCAGRRGQCVRGAPGGSAQAGGWTRWWRRCWPSWKRPANAGWCAVPRRRWKTSKKAVLF